MVFFLLGLQALKSMHARMKDSIEGSQVLHDRPRMSTTTIDFDYLVSFLVFSQKTSFILKLTSCLT